jgi:hypothetical protein
MHGEAPSNSPSARSFAVMATLGGEVVLFGGNSQAGASWRQYERYLDIRWDKLVERHAGVPLPVAAVRRDHGVFTLDA